MVQVVRAGQVVKVEQVMVVLVMEVVVVLVAKGRPH